MKQDFNNNRVTEKVLDIAIKSYGVNHLKNLNISATILMSECGYNEYEKEIVLKI